MARAPLNVARFIGPYLIRNEKGTNDCDIVILIDTEPITNYDKEINDIISLMKSAGLRYEIILISYSVMHLPDYKENVHVFNKNTINWMHLPQRKALGALNIKSAKWLISSYDDNCLTAAFISSILKSELKLRLHTANHPGNFDIILNGGGQSLKERVETALEYLTKISK